MKTFKIATMWYFAAIAFALILLAPTVFAQSPGTLDKKGQGSEIKLEKTVAGPLTELNGKYKFRVSETTYEPGGYIGEHHHAGPGIRLVKSGELTFVHPDKTTIYKAGDYFFETGDVTHKAYNNTKEPVVVVTFELLPVNWSGPSAIPPK